MAKPFSPALVGSGLIIAALLAGSAYYTYRTQILRLKNPAPVVINTSTPKETAPEPTVTCKELDTSFALSENEQNFVIKDLEPVQVRLAPFIYPAPNQALVLNPGQPSLITVKSTTDKSNSIVPVVLATSTYLVDDAQMAMVGQTWFLFSTEEWGLGSGLYRTTLNKIADRTLSNVTIPAKYSPKEGLSCPDDPEVLECPGGDENPISATELIGSTDAFLVFKTGYNTSTYVSFNVTSSRWQDLKADDVILKNLKPARKSLAKLFLENTCVSQETAFGTLVYRRNNLSNPTNDDWYNGLSGYSSVSIYWLAKK